MKEKSCEIPTLLKMALSFRDFFLSFIFYKNYDCKKSCEMTTPFLVALAIRDLFLSLIFYKFASMISLDLRQFASIRTKW